MAGKNWIQSAIKKSGSFKAKAKKIGLTVSKMADRVLAESSKYSTRTKRQAALARTLSKINKKKGE